MLRPRHRLAAMAALALAVAAAACAASTAGSGSRRNSKDAITAEDLDKYANEDLYDVLRRLRPSWLQSRAPYTAAGSQPVSIIVDGVLQQGGFDALRGFRAGDAREVRFLNSRDATTLYGTGMTAGAIVVDTRR